MAYVLSSISGNLISAASAGFAPTNSSEVSAIASAYQVVSATATQLYAGTAYVTSINEAPVSAARAGNSVNATLATSAYYDGTGRLISALPDNAAVSAIASSYAESAASGKLDSSASSSFYPANNPSGFISSVDLSNYATTAYVDSSISGFAYNSAVSGWTAKQDALTFGYNAEDKISGINGSALAGEGGGLVTAIGTSTSGITSINNSGLVDTAALRSADYSSLYVQEPLYISASGDSSYIGISGNVGGIDSATCSAIASAYAESAVSSVSGNYYTTANESGYALSSDVSATVDLVGTQSANWGGSALALSAGPGITLSKSGDTLTVSTETVLWSGTPVTVAAATAGLTLAESPYNFDRVALYWVPWNYTANSLEKQEAVAEAKITSAFPRIGSVTEWNAEASDSMFIFVLNAYFDSSKFYTQAIKFFSIGTWTVDINGAESYITKIVGINRTAEV